MLNGINYLMISVHMKMKKLFKNLDNNMKNI